MIRTNEIVKLIVLSAFSIMVGHPVLDGPKKKFSITPPAPKPKRAFIPIDDIYADRLQSAAPASSFIILDD